MIERNSKEGVTRTMEHAKELDHRTRYTVIPNYSVVIQQGNQTVVLTSEAVAQLHMDVSIQEPPATAVPPRGKFDYEGKP